MPTTADLIAATGRKCGSCSLCCKLIPIEDEQLVKTENEWCQHCKPGRGGCSIYADRPLSCSSFACTWLVSLALGDEWFPAASKIIVRDDVVQNSVRILSFIVDPKYPNRWREEPYFSAIRLWSMHGETQDFIVQILVGDWSYYVFPTRIIERRATITPDEVKRIKAELDDAMAGYEKVRQLVRAGELQAALNMIVR
jgi:hypothetical protein